MGPMPGVGPVTALLGSAVGSFLTARVVGGAIAGARSPVPLGGVVAFEISTPGFGAILRDYFGDSGEGSRPGNVIVLGPHPPAIEPLP